jgi:hypothetical protein
LQTGCKFQNINKVILLTNVEDRSVRNTASNIWFGIIGADIKKHQLLSYFLLQFGLDVINLAMNKTSAILQLLGFGNGQTEF